jgi:hypothetical protein
MAYIPPTPDIRRSRPELFMKHLPAGQDYPSEFRPHEAGSVLRQQREASAASWPELKQELLGMLQGQKPKYYTGTDLTEEEREHNKMVMAWHSPGGLSAIETGKYREFQQKLTLVQRAEARLGALEKQLIQIHKEKDAYPKGLRMGLEKSYNSAVDRLDNLLKGIDADVSGLPKYTGEGKLKLEGYEEEPSWLTKGIQRLMQEISPSAQEASPFVQPERQPWKMGVTDAEAMAGGEEAPPQIPPFAQPQPAPQAAPIQPPEQEMQEMTKQLVPAEVALRETLGDEADEVIEEIKRTSGDPGERLDHALMKILEKDPLNITAKKMRAARAARKMAAQRAAGTTGTYEQLGGFMQQ